VGVVGVVCLVTEEEGVLEVALLDSLLDLQTMRWYLLQGVEEGVRDHGK